MKIMDGTTRLWIKAPLVAATATATVFPPLPPVAEASSATMMQVEGLVKTEVGSNDMMSLSSHQHGHGMDSSDDNGEDNSDGTSSKRARMLENGEEMSLGRLMTSDITDLKGWYITTQHIIYVSYRTTRCLYLV